MIFVAVGTQLPFDRLVHAVDRWAQQRGRTDVFAQAGPTTSPPTFVQWKDFIPAEEFRRRTQEADVVVAHAGMGTILTALELGKPVLVMPRRADLGEHRNEHQLATARRFLEQGRIAVAYDETQLSDRLDELDGLKAADRISSHASPQLIGAVRAFVAGQDVAAALREGRYPGMGSGKAELQPMRSAV